MIAIILVAIASALIGIYFGAYVILREMNAAEDAEEAELRRSLE